MLAFGLRNQFWCTKQLPHFSLSQGQPPIFLSLYRSCICIGEFRYPIWIRFDLWIPPNLRSTFLFEIGPCNCIHTHWVGFCLFLQIWLPTEKKLGTLIRSCPNCLWSVRMRVRNKQMLICYVNRIELNCVSVAQFSQCFQFCIFWLVGDWYLIQLCLAGGCEVDLEKGKGFLVDFSRNLEE